MSSCWDPMYLVYDHVKKYDDASEDAFYQVEESIAPVDSSFGITWFLIISLKMFARKLTSSKPCRPTLSEIAWRPLVLVYHLGVSRTVCSFVCDFIALGIMKSELQWATKSSWDTFQKMTLFDTWAFVLFYLHLALILWYPGPSKTTIKSRQKEGQSIEKKFTDNAIWLKLQ